MRQPHDDAAEDAANHNQLTGTIPEVLNDGWVCPLPEAIGGFYEEKPDGNGIFWMPSEFGFSPANDKNLRRRLRACGLIAAGRDGHPQLEQIIVSLQQKRRVQGAGNIAGKRPGLIHANGKRFLVTGGPKLIGPDVNVDWSDLRQVIEGTLGLADEGRQLPYIYGWIKIAYEALRDQRQQFGQALVFAGPSGSGKTLLQTLITHILGGREGNPWPWMEGKTNFNFDFVGAEHLCFGDEIGDMSAAARRKVAAKIKGLVANPSQRLEAKGKEACLVKPFWRITMSVNEEPEYLAVVPPLDPSILDKLMLFKATPCPYFKRTEWKTMSMDAKLQLLVGQLSGLIHYLIHEVRIPDDMVDVDTGSRAGIKSYHNEELRTLLNNITSETRFLHFVDELVFASDTNETKAGCWSGRSTDLEQLLYSRAHVDHEKRQLDLLLSWPPHAAGNHLNKLSSTVCPGRVARKTVNGNHVYTITAPQREPGERVRTVHGSHFEPA